MEQKGVCTKKASECAHFRANKDRTRVWLIAKLPFYALRSTIKTTTSLTD